MSTSISRPIRLPVAGPSRTAVTDQLRAAGCVYAEEEAALLFETAGSPAELAVMIDQRVAGLPLEHVLGWVEFCGLRIAVDPGVFVPRRRTELLARRAAGLARPGAAVVDLGCGSGAVGMAVAALAGAVRLHAADIDPAAVDCARRNLAASGGRVHAGDLYDPLPHRLRGRVDVLVANVPYVPSSAVDLLPREARIHEPLVALDGGDDGLDVIRRVTGAAGDWLSPAGHLLLEISTRQVPAVVAALTTAGLTPTVVTDEELGATIVIGRRPQRAGHPDRPDPEHDRPAGNDGPTGDVGPAGNDGHAGGAGQDAVGMPSAGGGSGAAGYSFTGPSASSVS